MAVFIVVVMFLALTIRAGVEFLSWFFANDAAHERLMLLTGIEAIIGLIAILIAINLFRKRRKGELRESGFSSTDEINHQLGAAYLLAPALAIVMGKIFNFNAEVFAQIVGTGDLLIMGMFSTQWFIEGIYHLRNKNPKTAG